MFSSNSLENAETTGWSSVLSSFCWWNKPVEPFPRLIYIQTESHYIRFAYLELNPTTEHFVLHNSRTEFSSTSQPSKQPTCHAKTTNNVTKRNVIRKEKHLIWSSFKKRFVQIVNLLPADGWLNACLMMTRLGVGACMSCWWKRRTHFETISYNAKVKKGRWQQWTKWSLVCSDVICMYIRPIKCGKER